MLLQGHILSMGKLALGTADAYLINSISALCT
jgi:hypothetical protein